MASGWGGTFWAEFFAPYFSPREGGYGLEESYIPWDYSVAGNTGTVTISDIPTDPDGTTINTTLNNMFSYVTATTSHSATEDEVITTAQRRYYEELAGFSFENVPSDYSIYGDDFLSDPISSIEQDIIDVAPLTDEDLSEIDRIVEEIGYNKFKTALQPLELKISVMIDMLPADSPQAVQLQGVMSSIGRLLVGIDAGLTITDMVTQPGAESFISGLSALAGMGAAAYVSSGTGTAALMSATSGTALAPLAAFATGTAVGGFFTSIVVGTGVTAAVGLGLWGAYLFGRESYELINTLEPSNFLYEFGATTPNIGGGSVIDGTSSNANFQDIFDSILGRERAQIPPVVLDLDGDGLEVSNLADSFITFDLDGTGNFIDMSWVGPDDGIVFLDLDGDGQFSHIQEIAFSGYGDARTDLEGLAELDENNDGVIDTNDEVYHDLRIWQDANQNGVIDDGELASLQDLEIVSLSMESNHNFQDINGNVVYGSASFTNADGTTGSLFDVALEAVKSGTTKISQDGYDIYEMENGSARVVTQAGAQSVAIDRGGETDDIYSLSVLFGFNSIEDDGGKDTVLIGGDRDISDFGVFADFNQKTLTIVDNVTGGLLTITDDIEAIGFEDGQYMFLVDDLLAA